MIVPGRNPVIELLRSKFPVRNLQLQEEINADTKIQEIYQLASQRGITPQFVNRKLLTKFAGSEDHQGVIAETNFELGPITNTQLEKGGSYIYIREAQYEQNAAAVIRTAEVSGMAGVILPPDLRLSPTMLRISMGAVFHIPLFQHSLFPSIKQFQEFGMPIYGIERGGENIFKTKLDRDSLLIIGGEDHALSAEVLERCDKTLSIPQAGHVNSLNMSVAAGIAIYQITQAHNFN